MDCDDEVWLVKRNNDPHTNSTNFSGVPRLAIAIPVEIDRLFNNSFHVLDGCTNASR
jgi:hypothetical protein